MFVSRVLVGDYTLGSSSYVRPPSKDGGDTLFYDSCVDNIQTPSIFVVFDRPQIYPEFLLTYKERASLDSPLPMPSLRHRATFPRYSPTSPSPSRPSLPPLTYLPTLARSQIRRRRTIVW